MPQEFQVLRCCECEKFQVHHVKKAKKWNCKVCGQKQSFKRAFFIGSARDCRFTVQKLNFQVGEQEMRTKLGESCSSANVLEVSIDEDFNFSTENDWVGDIGENDWADENDWIDGDDGIDDNSSEIFNTPDDANSPSDLEDGLPRKKQRCESYSDSESVEENSSEQTQTMKNQEKVLFSSALKCLQDRNLSKPFEITDTSLNVHIPEVEDIQECVSVEKKEESSLTEGVKSKSNSLLRPTQGFQFILNEAKKQRTNLNFDLNF